jgi:perosamine synthetase
MKKIVEIKELLLNSNSTVKDALTLIDNSTMGICFIVNDDNQISGTLSDGDIRRGLINGATLGTPVNELMSAQFTKLSINSDNVTILNTLNNKVKIIPLVNEKDIVVDYATNQKLRRIPVSEPLLDGNELSYVVDCVKTTWVSSKGKYVNLFQEQFQDYCQVPYALAVSNGTVAIHLALEALGIGEGDEVIVPNMTFAASINAVLYAGATPVLADINPETLNISIESIKECITPLTKAIMPVHLYGYPCDMDEIMEIAKKHNLLVVEDCAEALGSTYKGKPVGSFGDAATFSFFGNKTITTGEGGMTIFKDEKIAEMAAVLKDHGMSKSKRYWHEYVGFNYRMTNLQAALGVAQMERIDAFVEKKRAIAKIYDEAFRGISGLVLPKDSESHFNSYWLYTMIVNKDINLEEMMENLLQEGVETRPIFFPLNVMPPYLRFSENKTFPGTEAVASKGISLPSSTNLSLEECRFVAAKIKNYLSEAGN